MMLPCLFKQTFHMDCPGCGFQRAVVALCKGELMTSLSLYPAVIPIIFLLIFTLLHLKFQFTKGGVLIKYLQVIIGILILAFYIYKILTLKVFN